MFLTVTSCEHGIDMLRTCHLSVGDNTPWHCWWQHFQLSIWGGIMMGLIINLAIHHLLLLVSWCHCIELFITMENPNSEPVFTIWNVYLLKYIFNTHRFYLKKEFIKKHKKYCLVEVCVRASFYKDVEVCGNLSWTTYAHSVHSGNVCGISSGQYE